MVSHRRREAGGGTGRRPPGLLSVGKDGKRAIGPAAGELRRRSGGGRDGGGDRSGPPGAGGGGAGGRAGGGGGGGRKAGRAAGLRRRRGQDEPRHRRGRRGLPGGLAVYTRGLAGARPPPLPRS